MTQTMQSGAHPDAEALTAFAEQMLSDAEREPVLAHMAVCGRCREVVFLAKQAAEVEEKTLVKAVPEPEKKVAAGWLTFWRWSWIPVAALAGIVGFAVLRHIRQTEAPQTAVAQSISPEQVKNTAARQSATVSPKSQPESKANSNLESGIHERSSTGKSRRDEDRSVEEKSPHLLDQKRNAEALKKDESTNETRLSGALASMGSGGGIAAREKPSSPDGSIAQKQSHSRDDSRTQVQGQTMAAAKAKDLSDAPNKAPSASVQVASASESVSVESDSRLAPSSAAPRSAPQLAADSLQMALPSRKQAKIAKSTLPSGLEVLSEASEAQKRIALDTDGSLFFSADEGKHWHPVKPFWTGRAVSVQIRPEVGRTSENALTLPATGFELSTDGQQKWISVDGQNWSLGSQAEK